MLSQVQPDPLIDFAQYGILGLVVVGFIMGWIWPRPAVERMIKSHDEHVKMLEAKIDEVLGEVKELTESVHLSNQIEQQKLRQQRKT